MNFIDGILGFLGTIVEFFYNIGGKSYLVALILFAVFVKILLLPLSIKQQKNQIKQAKLRPKEMAIRKKYAGRNDQPTQQKMQQEIMELYQKENFNPMGGCLPMLIQLPLLFALYEVIRNPLSHILKLNKEKVIEPLMKIANITEANGGQIGLISKMKENFEPFAETAKGHFTQADLPNFKTGIDFGKTPSLDNLNSPEAWLLLLVPVLTFVFMFFSMKINKKFTYNAAAGTQQDQATGCSMQIMDWIMPLMSVYISFIVPAVIGVYWIVNNILGTAQQVILAKVMPLPQFTEEDYKRAEKEMNGKYRPEKKTGEKKKVRSLHRIDEEDFEPEAPAPKKTAPAEKATGLAGMLEKPEMQDDDK